MKALPNRSARRRRVKQAGGNWQREQRAKRHADEMDTTALRTSPEDARRMLAAWAAVPGRTASGGRCDEQGEFLMPRQVIDVNEAQRLYGELRNWREVAGVLSYGRKGPPFHGDSVKNAVRKARQARKAADEPFDVG